MRKTIDLAAAPYNVVMGLAPRPPLSEEQYHIGEQNRLGIQQAFDDAYEEGYSDVDFVPFTTFVGYKLSNWGKGLSAGSGDELIHVRSNTDYNFLGCKIDVMYDSINKSPYHLADGTNTVNRGGKEYLLDRAVPFWNNGKVISFRGSKNTTIRNLELIGEIYKRSWVKDQYGKNGFAAENGQEQCYGIAQSSSSFNSKIINCNIHGFMGDSITGVGSLGAFDLGAFKVTTPFKTYEKGKYDIETNSIDKEDPNFYISDAKVLNRDALDNPYNLNATTVHMKRSGGSDSPLSYPSEQQKMIWFDNEDEYISETIVFQREPFEIPFGAVKVRMQLHNVPSTAETWVDPGNSIGVATTIATLSNYGVEVIDCEIYNNHRGGISNLKNNFIIDNCKFVRNGLDSGIGAPHFHDTTRYQINIEDVNITDGQILNSRFDEAFNGLLLSSNHIKVDNNVMTNSGGISLYVRTLEATITNNKLYNGHFRISDSGIRETSESARRRRYTVSGNLFMANAPIAIGGETMTSTDVIITGNHFVGQGVTVRGGNGYNIDYSHNHFLFASSPDSSYALSIISNLDKFMGNTFEKSKRCLSFRGAFFMLGRVKGSGNTVRGMTINVLEPPYGDKYPQTHITGVDFVDCEYKYQVCNSPNLVQKYTNCEFINTHPEFVISTSKQLLSFNQCKFKYDDDVSKVIGGPWASLRDKGDAGQELDFIDCEIDAKQATDLYLISVGISIQGSKIKVTVKNLYAPKWDGKKVLNHGNLLE